jgi:hypothetical protein
MNKIEKHSPKWHAEVAAELNKEANQLVALGEEVATRRTRFGFMLVWIKAMGKADDSIPHGGFRPWLAKHCPNLSLSTAGEWITQAKSLMDPLKWKESDLVQFPIPPHRLLLAKSDDLKGEDKAHLKALTDAQKKFVPLTRYTQVELKDDASVPKIGRAKGEGGASREQRAAHKQKQHEMDIKERKAFLVNLGEAADLAANKKGIGDPECAAEFAEVFPKIENLFRFMQSVREARGQK